MKAQFRCCAYAVPGSITISFDCSMTEARLIQASGKSHE